MGIIHSVYKHVGMPLTPEVEERMRAYLRSHPQNRHGKHVYSMGQFGISQADIEREFTGFLDYCQANGMTKSDFL